MVGSKTTTKYTRLFLKEHCIANKTQTDIMQLGLVSYHFSIPNLHLFSYRKAVLQKWRAKHGYRNLAKSFYDAGERSLVETVCEVVTHISSTDILWLHYVPSQRLWTIATSQACKYCVLCIVVAVAGMLSSSYVSRSDHPLFLGIFSK